MAISCGDALWGAVVARINLSWLLAYDACGILAYGDSAISNG